MKLNKFFCVYARQQCFTLCFWKNNYYEVISFFFPFIRQIEKYVVYLLFENLR